MAEKDKSKDIINYDNTRLSIQVSLDGFSFYVYMDSITEPLLTDENHTESTENPEKILLALKKSFEKHHILDSDFKEVQIVYCNNLFSVVPTAFFEPERLTDYLKYNVKILSTDFLAHDDLLVQEQHVIYIPFTNINNYLFDCFGSFTYHHHISLLLKETFQKSSESGKKYIKLQIRSTDFDLVAMDGKKLLLVNNFTYQTAEDFLYHVLFCFEQIGFDANVHELQLSGTIDVEMQLYSLLHNYVRNITIVESNPLQQLDFTT